MNYLPLPPLFPNDCGPLGFCAGLQFIGLVLFVWDQLGLGLLVLTWEVFPSIASICSQFLKETVFLESGNLFGFSPFLTLRGLGSHSLVPHLPSPVLGLVGHFKLIARWKGWLVIRGISFPISLIIWFRYLSSSGSQNIIASPVKPALPVRPIRWT